jgi:hypothetical protein
VTDRAHVDIVNVPSWIALRETRDDVEKSARQAKGFGRRSHRRAAFPPRATMDKTTEALLDASVGDFAETGG